MTRRFMMFGILIGLVFAVTPLRAHDDYRVVGTITKVTAKQLEVKNQDSKTYVIKMDDLTLIKRDKEKVKVSDLNTGLSVVVDARGDSEADLLALEVRIVPAIARKK